MYVKASIFMKICLLVAGLVLGLSEQSHAHKVLADAYAGDNGMIEGEVGFSNGDMAKNVPIEVFDAFGNAIGNTATDEDGIFFFAPVDAIDHFFRADLGAGHVAEFSVAAEDLPMIEGAIAAPKTGQVGQSIDTQVAASGVSASAADLHAIKQELKLLRKEIASYKEKNSLQNVLGGVGYIIGLCGLYVYFLSRRQAKKQLKGD